MAEKMAKKTGKKRPAARTSISYSARREDLAGGMPISLRMAPPSRHEFGRVRDPLIAKQLDDAGQSEAERRETDGKGSPPKQKLRLPLELRGAEPTANVSRDTATMPSAELRKMREDLMQEFNEKRTELRKEKRDRSEPIMSYDGPDIV